MACKPGTAGANELASLSRHAPLFTKTTARVPDPPFCSPGAIDHELPEDGADRGDLRLIASRSRASQAYRLGGRSSHCPGSLRPGDRVNGVAPA